MNSAAGIFLTQSEFHHTYVCRMIADLSCDELNFSNNVIKNNAVSIISHLLNARLKLLELAGHKAEGISVQGGAALVNRVFTLQECKVISAVWYRVHDVLTDVLSTLTEEIFTESCTFEVPFNDKSLRGVFAAYMTHEAYHCGQLGMIYSFAGKGRLMSV